MGVDSQEITKPVIIFKPASMADDNLLCILDRVDHPVDLEGLNSFGA